MKRDPKTENNPDNNKIIIHLKTLLKAQEEVLKEYLAFTEKERDIIISGDTVKLSHYHTRENEFIQKAGAYGKVIASFQFIYSGSQQIKKDFSLPLAGNPEIETLEASISRLQSKLLSLNRENRKLLKEKMESIEQTLEETGKKKRRKPTPYKKIGQPSLIDTSA
jgi:flagellar biosynthesis/type III secretory pathway chaperone